MTDLSEIDGALSLDAFCDRYDVGKTHAYALIAQGKLRAVKHGRRTLIPVAAAREWLANLPAYKPTPGVRFGQLTAA